MNYRKHFQTKATPQSKPVPGKQMVANNAGGYVFQADDWKRLDRFLILGSAGGTYYVGERELTIQNAEIVQKLLQVDGSRVVNRIVKISDAGRAPKNDQALFALAMAASVEDTDVRKLALENLSKVARTGGHLLQFLEYVEGFRGWGRTLKTAIANWYLDRDPKDLVYQVIKYQHRGGQKDGWSQRDAMRLSHPQSEKLNPIFKWVVKGEWLESFDVEGPMGMISAVETLKQEETEDYAVDAIIRQYKLPWEAVPTQFLKSSRIWKALLGNLPMTAMIRNLGRMCANETLTPMSAELGYVVKRLTDPEALKKARIHPMTVLVAMKTYERGRGIKGDLTWPVLHPIVDALDKAFYLCFGNVEPANKRLLFCVDASGSMTHPIIGGQERNKRGQLENKELPVSCREASVALALVNAAVEPVYHCVGFTNGDHIFNLALSNRMRLVDAMRALERDVRGNGTDCALPIQYASKKNVNVDAFVMLTDGETWAGNQHVFQALNEYRRKVNPNAKFVVQAMAANRCSIADPNDLLSLDIAGFDTTTPQVISDFVKE